MRAKRIDEIRRGKAPMPTLGVGDVRLHRAWNELIAVNGDPDHADNPSRWMTLLEKHKEFRSRFPSWVVAEISRAMDADADRIAIEGIGTSHASTDAVMSDIMADASPYEKELPQQPNGITRKLTMMVNDDAGGGGISITSRDRDGRDKTYTYYVIRIPGNIHEDERVNEIKRSDDGQALGAIGTGRTQHSAAWRELEPITSQHPDRKFFARPRIGTMGECRTLVARQMGCSIDRVVMLNPFLGKDLIGTLEGKCRDIMSNEAASGNTSTRRHEVEPYGSFRVVNATITVASRVGLASIEVNENDRASTYYMMTRPVETNEIRRGGDSLSALDAGAAVMYPAYRALPKGFRQWKEWPRDISIHDRQVRENLRKLSNLLSGPMGIDKDQVRAVQAGVLDASTRDVIEDMLDADPDMEESTRLASSTGSCRLMLSVKNGLARVVITMTVNYSDYSSAKLTYRYYLIATPPHSVNEASGPKTKMIQTR